MTRLLQAARQGVRLLFQQQLHLEQRHITA